MTSLEPTSIGAIFPSGDIFEEVSPGMSWKSNISDYESRSHINVPMWLPAYWREDIRTLCSLRKGDTYGPSLGEAGAVGGVSAMGRRNPSDLASPVRDKIA